MVRRANKLWIGVACVGLAGCAMHKGPGHRMPMSRADADVAEAAVSVAQHVARLGETSTTRPPMVWQPSDQALAHPALQQRMTLHWDGPVEPVLQRVADAMQFRFKVVGRASGLPVWVRAEEEQEPIGQVLRRVAVSVQPRAQVVVYPALKTLELWYNP